MMAVMTWFKSKGGTAKADPVNHHRHHHVPQIDDAMLERLARFLVERGRLKLPRNGRPPMHILGTSKNYDGSKDYSIRTHVHYEDGSRRTFDSHIRWYESDHLRLLR
jgi:hypothetical protein